MRDVSSLLGLLDKQDAQGGTGELKRVLQDYGVAKADVKGAIKGLENMPHVWTMVFGAVPFNEGAAPGTVQCFPTPSPPENWSSMSKLEQLRWRKENPPPVLREGVLKFECALEMCCGKKKDQPHEGRQWVWKKVIDPYENWEAHKRALGYKVTQRADLADEQHLLRERLARAPPPHIVEQAEAKKQDKLRELHERYKEKVFLANGRDHHPSEEKQAEMREEAEEVYLEHLDEWVEEEWAKLSGRVAGVPGRA